MAPRSSAAIALSFAVVCSLAWVPAFAAEPTASEKATARALFDEGRRLVEAGQVAQACPKFEESQRLDPGSGTQFNLADCWERENRTASAWTLFLEVASAMKAAGQTSREQAARERAAALEKRLSRLKIVVDREVPGLEIRRDGEVVGKATWGLALPVDPGTHRIEVSAPGSKPWSERVEVAAGPSERAVTVPALGAADASPPVTTPAIAAMPATVPTPQADNATPGGTQKTIGLIVGGVGVVGLGVGAALGLGAKSKFDESKPHCDSAGCDPEGLSIREDAVSKGNVATIVSGIGLVGLVGGAVLYFTAPSKPKPASSAGVMVHVGLGSVNVGGRW